MFSVSSWERDGTNSHFLCRSTAMSCNSCPMSQRAQWKITWWFVVKSSLILEALLHFPSRFLNHCVLLLLFVWLGFCKKSLWKGVEGKNPIYMDFYCYLRNKYLFLHCHIISTSICFATEAQKATFAYKYEC